MIIQQYVHQLNNSELGRTGVHETYVSVPRNLVPLLDFVEAGDINVIFKRTGQNYELRFKKYNNGEFRFTGLGALYRLSDANAGDLIIIEVLSGKMMIDFVYRNNLIVFGAQGQGLFECRNEDRLNSFVDKEISCYKYGKPVSLKIIPRGSVRPRVDSAREVNVFELNLDGEIISRGRNQALNFFYSEVGNFLVPSSPDIIHKFEWSEYE